MLNESKTLEALKKFISVVEELRSEHGCPWDKAQTHESMIKCLRDECEEVVQAIEEKDDDNLCEELGDVLLQVVFHTQMEKENGSFDFDDVCDGICRKLIVRHPHIFGEEDISSASAVANRWEEIKKLTKGQKTGSETLLAVPKQLPALMRCEKLLHRAEKATGRKLSFKMAFKKLDEEASELREAEDLSADEAKEKIGDLLFSAVNAARTLGLDPEECLTASSEKFILRFEKAESSAKEKGFSVAELDEKEAFSLLQGANKNV